MLRRRIIAVVTTLALALGMSVGGAGTAFADHNQGHTNNQQNPNHQDYWKAKYPHAVECYKHSRSGGDHGTTRNGGVELNTFVQSWPGDRWEVLIVKGGSSGGDGNGNAVYDRPNAGQTYFAPINPNNNKPYDVSHWIVCKGATPAAASLVVTPETCTSAATVTLGNLTRAVWSPISYTDAAGGKNFGVVATAVDGSTFPVGTPNVNQQRTAQTFTGFLPNANPAACATATGDVNLGSPSCEAGAPAITTDSFFDVVSATGTIVKDGSADGSVEVLFTAAEGTTFSAELNGTRFGKTFAVSVDGRTLTVTGVLAAADPTLCGAAFADLVPAGATCELGAPDITAATFAEATTATGVIVDAGGEDRDFEVVFTAASGTRFASDFTGATRSLTYVVSDGGRTLTITGTLADANEALCELVEADVATGNATCELAAPNVLQADLSGDFASADITNPEGTNGGTFVVVFTAADGTRFAADYAGANDAFDYEVSEDRRTLTVTGELAPADLSLCDLATASVVVPGPTCETGSDWEARIVSATGATFEVTREPNLFTLFTWEVTFTAEGGYAFLVDGEYTKTFTVNGQLDLLPNTEDCDAVAAQIGFTDPACNTAATLDQGAFTSTPEGVVEFSILIDGDNPARLYTVVATADPGYRFDNGLNTTLFTGFLAGPDQTDCEEATLVGSIATTACETDVPYILFSIELNDPDNQSTAGLEDAEIIFSGLDSEGNERELVLDNLEGTVVDGVFSGRVLWPGAAIVDGQAAGWPGWELVDGEWTNVGDDNFGWTRSLSSVTLSVNPSLVVDLSYPQASPECATDPTVVDAFVEYSYDCLLGGSIELSDTPGVIWTVDGEQTDQRVFTGLAIDDQPVITASLDPEMPGLFFSPESITELTVEFELPEEGCDLVTSPLVTPTLSTTQATCTTAGSYTLNAVEGVQWLVNGQVTAPGTYTATTGSTVEVEAVALQGFGFGFETQTEWTLSFPAPAAGACDLPTLSLEETDLPTLALTGASGMLGTVGIIALLITLTGIGAVVARRRVEA